MVLYITLHLLWRQFYPASFRPSGPYLILPFSFLALFILVLAARSHPSGITGPLIGRWLPQRSDWPIAVAFMAAALVLRVLLKYCFEMTAEARQPAVVADLAALAPFNEELIFRGLFLGILLARLPGARWVAVVWSAAIFLGFHSIAGSDVVAVAGIFSLGLLCGAAYVTTRCVPLCIACHSLFNVSQWWIASKTPGGLALPDFIRRSGLFVFAVVAIGWMIRLLVQRQRRRHPAQQSG